MSIARNTNVFIGCLPLRKRVCRKSPALKNNVRLKYYTAKRNKTFMLKLKQYPSRNNLMQQMR